MSEEVWIAIISAGGIIAAAIIGPRLNFPRQFHDPRSDLERDLKMLASLPSTSPAREALQESIDGRIITMVTPEVAQRRDWFGGILAILVLLLFGGGALRLGTWGGWWWIGAVPAGFIAACMLIVIPGEFKKTSRNEQGVAVHPGEAGRES